MKKVRIVVLNYKNNITENFNLISLISLIACKYLICKLINRLLYKNILYKFTIKY